MKVNGLANLLKFSQRLQDMPKALRAAEQAIMTDWKDRATQGFADESDPYGASWKARKVNTGLPILTGKTRKLKRLKLVRLTGHRWAIVTAGKDYVGYHQSGTSRMPQRRVFPDEGRLPASWRKAGQDIYRKTMRQHFGR